MMIIGFQRPIEVVYIDQDKTNEWKTKKKKCEIESGFYTVAIMPKGLEGKTVVVMPVENLRYVDGETWVKWIKEGRKE